MNPQETAGQDITKKTISIEAESTTVSNVLDNIYKDYSIKFAFNAKELNKFKIEKISIREKPLGEALEQLLKGTGHLYKSIGNQIVIYKNNEQDKPQEISTPKAKSGQKPKVQEENIHKHNTIRILDTDTIFKTDTIFLKETIFLRDTIKLKDTVVIYKTLDSQAKPRKIRNSQYSMRVAYSQELTTFSTSPKKEEISDLSLRSFGVNIEGGYTRNNLDLAVGIGVNALRHEINFTKKENPTQIIHIDTTDIYYNIIEADTIFHYVTDSTVVNLPGIVHEINDINSLTYLGISASAAYYIYKNQKIRLFAKAAFSVGFLLNANGYQMNTKDFRNVKTSFLVGFGSCLTLSKQCDIVPEVFFRNYNGNLHKGSDIKATIHAFGIKIGLHYYF